MSISPNFKYKQEEQISETPTSSSLVFFFGAIIIELFEYNYYSVAPEKKSVPDTAQIDLTEEDT